MTNPKQTADAVNESSLPQFDDLPEDVQPIIHSMALAIINRGKDEEDKRDSLEYWPYESIEGACDDAIAAYYAMPSRTPAQPTVDTREEGGELHQAVMEVARGLFRRGESVNAHKALERIKEALSQPASPLTGAQGVGDKVIAEAVKLAEEVRAYLAVEDDDSGWENQINNLLTLDMAEQRFTAALLAASPTPAPIASREDDRG